MISDVDLIRRSVYFNEEWYLSKYGDVAQLEMSPAEHYLKFGGLLLRDPSPNFSAKEYMRANNHIVPAGENPLVHYIKSGNFEIKTEREDALSGVAKNYTKKRIAVIFHAYHPELISDCLEYISNIDEFDLFVTCPQDAGSQAIWKIVDKFPQAKIFKFANSGRDIGPFIKIWSEISQYDICCKLHTKKGTTDFADVWREICFGSTVGTKKIVSDVVEKFVKDPRLAIIGPECMYKSGARMLGSNGNLLESLEAMIGLSSAPADAEGWGFFAGSVFWFRPSLMSALGKLSDLDFGTENGADDGGVAHAVERLFGSRVLHPSSRIGYVRRGYSLNTEISVQQAPGTPDEEPYLVTLAKYADGSQGTVTLKGNIEGNAENSRFISGWLAMLGDSRPRRVVLQFDGEDVHYIEAKNRRDDLVAANINDGMHAFTFEVPNTYKDGVFHDIRLVDTLSGVQVGRRQMRWDATLPDVFALTSRQSFAETVVVLTGRSQPNIRSTLAELQSFSSEFDLILPSNLASEILIENANCKHISHVSTTRTLSGAAFFTHLVNSAFLCRYTNICWLDIGDSSEGLTGVWDGSASLALGDVGVAAAVVSRHSAGDTPDYRKNFIAEAMTRTQRGKSFDESVVVDVGCGALWIAPVILWQLRACNIDALTLNHPDSFDTLSCLLSVLARDGDMSVMTIAEARKRLSGVEIDPADNPFRTIAFFLPQFHRVPENDRWWSAGFTEWSNVVRGRPLFEHHDQPKLPSDLGFYDLTLPSTRAEQAALAKKFGLYGFCYYYYWFDGKKLLNQPIEGMLRSGEPEMPFCICWANENWTRSWDGQNRFVLEKQNYSPEALQQLVRELIGFMRDPRYIRHHGRPVLIVYRIGHIPNWLEIAEMWRQECRDAGIGEIHLCAVRFGAEPLRGAPEDNGVDSFVIFPPHESPTRDTRHDVQGLVKDFAGEIRDYDEAVAADLDRFKDGAPWPVHRGTMLSWDNTARRNRESRVYVGATPLRFRSWMRGLWDQIAGDENGEQLVFVNAWNEWAEGTTLEPSQRFGLGNLEALRSVLDEARIRRSNVVSASHGKVTSGAPYQDMHFAPGRREVNPEWPTVLMCAHIAGKERFGGERSFIDVLEGMEKRQVNIVVVLPAFAPYLAKPKGFPPHEIAPDYLDEILRRSAGVWSFPYQWYTDRRLDEGVVSRFSHIVMQHEVDAVHANTIMLWEPLIAARRLGRKTVIHARELIDRDLELTGFMKSSAGNVIQHVNQSSDYLIANSRETMRCFEHPRTFYVPNAATTADLDMSNVVSGKLRFAIIGSNIRKKGIIDFIECAIICKERAIDAEFVIVGPESPLIASLKKGDGEVTIPSNVVFAGYKDTPREAIETANVVMNLSHFAESFGRTVAEAMAARRPVIAYDWGALPELVEDGKNGFLVPYRDINAVVEKVAYLCAHPEEVGRMGDYGHSHIAAQYSQVVLEKNLKEAYDVIFSDYKKIEKPRRLSVIVPIYNAFDEVKKCLESLGRTFRPSDGRVVLIDDKSTDPKIVPLMQGYAGDERFEIIKNEENLGYTKTINKAIAHCAGDDVILLNSDTIVTQGWISGLQTVAYSRDNVGTVTAMSDNAGAFSFPHMGKYNPKPDGVSHTEYVQQVIKHSANIQPVEVPTGSGFCLYIRAKLIEEIGLFDDVAFPKGYGEENDYCMRALGAGWVNLISPLAFVFHAKSASFKGSRDALVKRGMDALASKYPAYNLLVKEAFSSRSIADLRGAVGAAIEELKNRRSVA